MARKTARVAVVGALVAGVAASLWGCGRCSDRSGGDDADKPPVARELEGLQAMPGGVNVVVGADVRVLRDSWLVERAVAQMFRRDPELKGRFAELVGACNVDPASDLDSVLIGLAGDDAVMVLTGRFVEADLASCVSQSMAADGGSLTFEAREGRMFYKAGGRAGASDHVWFTVAGSRTLVVATSSEWLARAAGSGAKVTASETMAALLSRVNQTTGLWAVGEVDERNGAGLVELTGGQVATPPRSMIVEVDPGSGLRVLLGADMATEEDAKHLSSLIKKQLAVGGWVLAGYGLGPVLHKLGVDSGGKTVYLRLSLDRDELHEVLSSLDTTARPDPNSDNNPDGGPAGDAGPGRPGDKPEE